MDEDAPFPVDPPDTTPQSIGAYLAAQRRLRGISVEELSSQTRIPLRSLERLEAGSFDSDVDGFVRGFVRTVAEALGLDPDETLNRTLEEPGPESAHRAAPRLSLQRVVAAVLGVAVLAALGLAAQLIAIRVAGGPDEVEAAVTVRRDPVRALAEAQGIAVASPALSLASSRGVGAGREDDAPVATEPVPPVASPATP